MPPYQPPRVHRARQPQLRTTAQARRLNSLKGRPVTQWPPPCSPGGTHQLKGSHNNCGQLNNGWRLRDHQKDHGNRLQPPW